MRCYSSVWFEFEWVDLIDMISTTLCEKNLDNPIYHPCNVVYLSYSWTLLSYENRKLLFLALFLSKILFVYQLFLMIDPIIWSRYQFWQSYHNCLYQSFLNPSCTKHFISHQISMKFQINSVILLYHYICALCLPTNNISASLIRQANGG